MALGDSFRGFRIVGMEPAFVAHYGAQLAQGSAWAEPMEAVLGADVARATGLAVGATFTGSHGLAEGGADHGDAPYRVVGVLAPTGRAIDRLALTAIDTVWQAHAHGANDAADDRGARSDSAAPPAVPATEPAAGREVTLALVTLPQPARRGEPAAAINTETPLQAASPAYESARLFTVFAVATDMVRGFALLLIGASAFGLFVALTQALDERRYDLAIMRALGARRGTVVAVILMESLLLAATGLVLGLGLAHGLAAGVGAWLPAAAPLAAAAWTWAPEEWGWSRSRWARV